MNNVLVHSFLSDGLYDFAELFLGSFYQQHGSDIPVLLTTMGLSQVQIDGLHAIYPNLEVENTPMDMNHWAKVLEVDLETVTRWKNEIEQDIVSPHNFPWKLMMAVESRYRGLRDLTHRLQGRGIQKILHSDIDAYFRRSINSVWALLDECDVAVTIRENAHDNFKIYGALFGFNLTPATDRFLACWNKHIDAIPPAKKPQSYGQLSCYYAYLEQRNDTRFVNLAEHPLGLKLCKKHSEDAHVWAGNGNNGKYRKADVVSLFKRDYDSRNQANDTHDVASRQLAFPAYSIQHPSDGYRQACITAVKTMARAGQTDNSVVPILMRLRDKLQQHGCESLLDVGSNDGARYDDRTPYRDEETGAVQEGLAAFLGIEKIGINVPLAENRLQNDFMHAVLCAGVLEHIPEQDIPWLVDELFRLGERCIAVAVDCSPRGKPMKSADWWAGLFDATASRYPGKDFVLCCHERRTDGDVRRQFHERLSVPQVASQQDAAGVAAVTTL